MSEPAGVNPAGPRCNPTDRRWVLAAFAAALLIQLETVFNRPINWDEFYHLSEVHAFHQGRLGEYLQVFYARAFFWLPLLPLDLIDQLRVARLFMLGCELVTASAIFGIARHFTGRLPALLAAMAYVTGGYVFQHGFSFRADPIAAALLMGTLWILLTSRLGRTAVLGAAVLTGLAFLTTVKIVLYAPAFAAVFWLRWHEAEDRRQLAMALLGYCLLALVCAALMLGLTWLTLPGADPAAAQIATRRFSSAGGMMFGRGLFPEWPFLFGAIAMAPVLAILIVKTPQALARGSTDRNRTIALAMMMLPLLSVAFYANSFPYFYAFVLPPVVVAAATTIAALLDRIPARLFALALLLNAAAISVFTTRSTLQVQRDVIAQVHRIFPQPVRYFDFSGMVSDYPKANVFMTNWGVRKYWAGLEPSFSEILASEEVPLLLANHDILERNQAGPAGAWELKPEDRQALRDGFIPHWGPVWVAGHRFSGPMLQQEFVVRTPGTYTLEGSALRIDGIAYQAGSTLVLTRGSHAVSRSGHEEATLRWGDHLIRPTMPYAGGALMSDFGKKK